MSQKKQRHWYLVLTKLQLYAYSSNAAWGVFP